MYYLKLFKKISKLLFRVFPLCFWGSSYINIRASSCFVAVASCVKVTEIASTIGEVTSTGSEAAATVAEFTSTWSKAALTSSEPKTLELETKWTKDEIIPTK